MNIQKIFNILKNKGFRLTPVRKGMISYIASAKRPVDDEQIKAYLNTKPILFNRTTIYRELKFLTDEKIITEIMFPDGVKRYEVAHLKHHHHVICKKCKKIEPIYLDEKIFTKEVIRNSPKNFSITGHVLEFSGFCEKCK